MTKRFCLFMIVVATLMTPFVGVSAEDEVTLKGEPVDISCYLSGKSGEGHASCAKSCVQGGKPVGFVTTSDDGEKSLYLVVGGGGKAAKDYVADHMGKIVQAKGTVVEKDGLKILTVSEVTGD